MLYTDGSLDPVLIAKMCMSLLSGELGRFAVNMAQEINFYDQIGECNNLAQMEKRLRELIPIERATIWVRTQDPHFLLLETLVEFISTEIA
jgi:hypothetical protein